MSTNFPVNTFYSHKNSKRLLELEVKLEQGVSESKKRPLPPLLTSSILGYPLDWKIFHKQAEALDYAKRRGLGLMTFAFEEQIHDNDGRRKYVVTHPTNMWKNHICRPPDKRCSYEVIPIETQCKLYFDLEFNKLANPSSDGNKMVETLLAASFWAFEEIYQLEVMKCEVLVLDASTPTKFSQHLIYQSSEVAFQDNNHVGKFVKYLMTEVKKCRVPKVSADEQRDLFVKNEKGESVSFCDLSVYTKNRNFRLFLASKFEKKIPLIIAEANKYLPNRICYKNEDWPTAEAAFFSSSLITYFGTCQSKKRLLTFDGNTYEGMTPTDCSQQRAPLLKTKHPSLNGYSGSPWIEIDRFIEGLVAPAGTVRQWVYFENTETIVYHIHGSRFCSSIGREHKRNHIKYVVNIPNATYYQSCFDLDCAKSRPLPQPIPPKHLPWISLLTDSSSLTLE